VEDVDLEGGVTVRAWARPSGWEGLTIIDVHNAELDRSPVVGDLLWIWTWLEIDRAGERQTERIVIEVEHRELSEDDRAGIRALLGAEQDDVR
jgi:hypothetical protein